MTYTPQNVNVAAARAAHEARYEAERHVTVHHAIEGEFNWVPEDAITYRVNIPMPCGDLLPVDDDYKREGWTTTHVCENGDTWHVARSGGIVVRKMNQASPPAPSRSLLTDSEG